MTSGQAAVVGILVTVILGIVGIVFQARAARREQKRQDAEAERLRILAIDGAREAGYQSGAADVRRELQPQLNLATSERDAARTERAQFERDRDVALRRIEILEDEIRRIMRGGNGK